MPKRKHNGNMHPDRKLQAAPSSGRHHRTVAQIATGSIGIHRVVSPRASLLGLPRELRDLIYSYIPHEISCVPEDSQSHRIRYPRDAGPYTNNCPAPAMYEGLSIGPQVVDELAHLASAKGWHRHPMLTVCRQLSKEYLDFFRQRNFQAQRIHFLVRGFNFETVIRVIKKWRPAHVVIELCDDYYWQEGAVHNLVQWCKSCRTPSLARRDQAEIHGHLFKLTYQRELRYHSPSLLAQGRRRQLDMARGMLRSLLGLSMSERKTLLAMAKHICKAISWMDTYNGNSARVWEGWIKAAKRDVKIAQKNKPKSGLANTSKLLGRKRDLEDMEAGGLGDPSDAKMRAMVKRWAVARDRKRLAQLTILEQLGNMDLEDRGSERSNAAGNNIADGMEIEPSEVVNEKGSFGIQLEVVVEKMSKLTLA
ncbi:hypothetical protein AC578_9973 [Pseudocercospora eumusae]|uniref:F-box domain-containing protein n=1 Tax=Pseudocercospora eumusae TaxID=321146 RepID=A0A139HMG1_9PEZI|nr:hypothetical protein AC578_9973 [Pseudocercospora eumusae]